MGRLRSLLKRLFGTEGFRASVLTLLTGTTVALSLSYLSRPILTRLYPPEAFGTLDFFVSVMGVLIAVASLRYEDALMIPEDDAEAGRVLGLAVVLTTLSALLSLLLGVFGVEIATVFGDPSLAPWLWLVPPSLLVMRFGKLAELWLTRLKRFAPISAAQVAHTTTMVATRIGAGVPPVQAGAGGLIGGFVLGYAVALGLLLRAVLRESGDVLRHAFSLRRLREPAWRYRRFALFSTPSTLFNALLQQLPPLLLLFFFDKTTLGLFGQATKVLLIPLALLGAAIAQVFFVHAAEAHRDGRLADLSRNVHARLVMLATFPTLALLAAGPDVYDFVFGGVWRVAGQYVQYIAPWLFFTAIAAPLTRLFDVLERQRLDLITSVVMFGAQAAALVWGGLTGDVVLTLMLLGGVGAAVRLFQIVVLLRIGGLGTMDLLRPYGRYLLFALPGLAFIGAVLPLGQPGLSTLAVAVGGGGYLGLVAWRDRLLPWA